MPNQIHPDKKKIVFLGFKDEEDLLKLIAQRRGCTVSAIYRCAVRLLLENPAYIADAEVQEAINAANAARKKKGVTDKKI